MANDLVVTIGMEDGTPTVTWPSQDDCSKGTDRKACAHGSYRVTWELDGKLGDRVWAVLFTEDAPFTHKHRVFSPMRAWGRVKPGAKGEFKYHVALADDHGKIRVLDPKIMIREEPPSETQQLQMMAAEVEDLADETASLEQSLREVAGTLRELAEGEDIAEVGQS